MDEDPRITGNTSEQPLDVRARAAFSSLGLGTASFGSRVGRAKGLHLFEVAFEAGIRHIDTARAYGYGDSEAIVGEFLRRHRDDVTVATKVGILPPRKSPVLSVAKGLTRMAAAVAPSLKNRMRRRAGGLISAGQFDVDTMTQSFETSLRALRTEYVDVLLLHECGVEDVARAETHDFLLRMRSEGRARKMGVATCPVVIRFALQHARALCEVLQFAASPLSSGTSLGKDLPATSTPVVHSIFEPWLPALVSHMGEDKELRRYWAERLAQDVSSREVPTRLALHATRLSFPGATVLFGSTSAEHIRANAASCASLMDATAAEDFLELLSTFRTAR